MLDRIRDFQGTRKAVTLFEEFKAFALKGSVIDLAIGVIIGGAFGTLVKSLVDNIIMPVLSLVLPGEQGYRTWAIVIGSKTIPFGLFLADVVNFLLLAAVLYFFIVRFLAWVTRLRTEEAAAPPPPTRDQELLMEIRDLLKQQPPRGEGVIT